MSLYEVSIPQFKKMLENLEGWLDKAVAFAETKKFDPNALLSSRLAPDQFPLAHQIQAVCDQAKFTAARLTNKEAPKHPDTEQTIDELRTRIRSVIAYLDTFNVQDFEAAEERAVLSPALHGAKIRGEDYLFELQIPNFYFHLTTAYAILRHNGVDLGKKDFIGRLNLLSS